MILVAKADGAIQDSEKQIISEKIGSLNVFTNSEKKELFNMIKIKLVPDLTKNDVKFSSSADTELILKNLINVALVDGAMDIKEKEFIDKIKMFIGK